jgi:hypothetical protein
MQDKLNNFKPHKHEQNQTTIINFYWNYAL